MPDSNKQAANVDTKYLNPRQRVVPSQPPADPRQPFAQPGEEVTHLTPEGEFKMDYDTGVQVQKPYPYGEHNLSPQLKMRGLLEISKLDEQLRAPGISDVWKSNLIKMREDARRRLELAEKMAGLSGLLSSKGQKKVAASLLGLAEKLAASIAEKEHSVPSLESIHQAIPDLSKAFEAIKGLQQTYQVLAGIVGHFASEYNAHLNEYSKDEAGHEKLVKAIRKHDTDIHNEIKKLERRLPGHPNHI